MVRSASGSLLIALSFRWRSSAIQVILPAEGHWSLTAGVEGAKKCIKGFFAGSGTASMAAALASAYRVKGKRRRVRRRTSGRTVYAYVSGNPVSFIDPLGLAGKKVNLGSGYTGRVDTFNYGESASFEVHVYGPRGNEVGVYGPDGWINKHGFKGAPEGLPDDVHNQCKSVADDYSRRTGLHMDRASRRSSKLKNALRGWPFIGPLIEMATPSPARICDANPNYPGCEEM